MKHFDTSNCNGCGLEKQWLLHNIRRQGIFHRLCTSCVLKFNAGSFCPICFDVYEGSPPKDQVSCMKCTSVSHLDCVMKEKMSTSAYVCSSCSNPNFRFFDVGGSTLSDKSGIGNGDGSVEGQKRGEIDLKLAKVLVAAAKIASVLMNKAASALRIEAERKVKEATLAKKRAREALELVAVIGDKEKEKGKKMKGKEKEPIMGLSLSSYEAAEHEQKLIAQIAAAAKRKQIPDQLQEDGNDKSSGDDLREDGGDHGVSVNDNDKLTTTPNEKNSSSSN